MIFGYARVSNADAQDAGLAAQVRDLLAAGCERVDEERASAATTRRPVLAQVLDYLRAQDTLAVTRPDRLARSVGDLLAIVAKLEAKGVNLRILSMGGAEVDTRSPTGRLMLTTLGAVAEFERNLMLERQKEGIAKRKAQPGGYPGRVPTARQKAPEALRLHAAGIAPTEIARRLGIGRASVYRAIGPKAQPKAAMAKK